jgi:hypothetical protein
VIDSVTIRISFDKYLDPVMPLQPALVSVQRADSTQLEITRVEGATPFERARAARDSARRADSLRALPRRDSATAPTTQPAQPAVPVPVPGGARPAPPPPKPRMLAPERSIIITLAPSSHLTPGGYRVTVRGFRNLVGHSHTPKACAEQAQLCSRPFTVSRPPPPKPPADTAKRPPGDSVRRPPSSRGRN